MGNGFVGWFARSYKAIIVVLIAVMAASLVVLAMQHVSQSRAAAGTQAGPVPTFTSKARTTEPAVTAADGKVSAVFLGDSLTYGLYASTEAAGWRPQMVERLSKLGEVNATRAGQTGNTVAAVSGSATIPADANVVFIELGTNDLYKTDIDVFAKQYADLTEKAQQTATGAKIVCLGVWGPADAARNYDAKIQTACRSTGGTFVALSPLYTDPANRGPAGQAKFGGTSDDFHPNDTGYKAIASAVGIALRLR